MYTDLLLGLAVVFLGSIGVVVATSSDETPPAALADDGDGESLEAVGSPTASTTSTSTTTPTTSTTAPTTTTLPLETCQVLYDPEEDPEEAFKVRIAGRPNPDDFAAQFRREMSDRLSQENRLRTDGGEFSFDTINVALVLVYHGPSGASGSNTDTEVAEQIYADLKTRFPQQFANAVVRVGKIDTGRLRTSIEIFINYERPCTVEP